MHPSILSNIICSDITSASFNNILQSIDSTINKNDCLLIPYMNPGKDLSLEIYKQYSNHTIIFLLNHGIIFTNDSLSELHTNIIKVLKPSVDIFDLQTITNKLVWKSKFQNTLHIGSLNMYIPDIAIYLGYEIVNGTSDNINYYIKQYNCNPILIYFGIMYLLMET